ETERTLGQENFAHYGVVQKVLAGNSGVGLYYYKGIEMLGAYVPVEPSGWGVIVQQPLAAANAPAIKLRHLMVTVVIVSVIIAVFLGVLIAHRISTPLARLESSAATIATGNLEEPVPALGQDEIGRLAKTFDGMRLSLEESKGQLEKANETLKVLLDATPATVLLLDPEGIVLAANAMVARRLGKTVQEIMGTCIYSHMPPDLAETRKARVDEMKLSGQPVHFEDMRENRHLDNYIHPIFTPTGDLACFAVLSLDITERKQAEAARQESEERLRLFIEYAPAALAMLDKEMRYLSVSRRWLVDYGSGDRDILGLSHYEIFPELPERWKEAHRRGLAGEVVRSESDCFKRSDGSVQWERWEVRPWYDTAGEVGGILILTEDITARQQAEAERDRLFNLSLDMLCIAGFDGFFKQVNPAGEKLLGWTGQELLRKPWIEFVHPEDRAASMVAAEQLAAGEVVSAFENRFQCRDGSYRWFSWNALPLLEEGLIF
ncbi:MAG: PAS domain S-box protein, partial [Deltaproteobacteria bacterium]|nr:PAS domain S-box protein [Deltaproteobacteria bacterium]